MSKVPSPEMSVADTRGRTTQKRVSSHNKAAAWRSIWILTNTDFKSPDNSKSLTIPTRTERQRTSVLPAAMPSAVSKRTWAMGPREARF